MNPFHYAPVQNPQNFSPFSVLNYRPFNQLVF
jgi:hypothetical protein